MNYQAIQFVVLAIGARREELRFQAVEHARHNKKPGA
jgi:hypothetical protein